MSGPAIAVFGVGGQLGSAIWRVGEARDGLLDGFNHEDADITSYRAVEAALNATRPDLVVNAAAYTAVDKAESDGAAAFAVNRDGAANLARAANALGLPFIHVSTDYVFDGAKSEPYCEDDPIAPLGIYGRSKAAGETAVRAENPRAVILRTAWVYGLDGANFVKTMLRLAAERDVVRVVDDQHGSPTFADDLADAILTIAESLCAGPPAVASAKAGTYHLAATGSTTWHDFARAIFTEAARYGLRTPRLEAIQTSDYPTPAKRPANSVLDCSKAKRVFGVELPPWNEGLSRMLHAHLKAV